MKTLLLVASLLAVCCPGCGSSGLLDHPVYPLMGIVSADPRMDDRSAVILEGADAFVQCRHYRLLYSSRSSVLDLIKDGVNQYAPECNVIVYTGGFTVQPTDVSLVDREYRKAVAMYPAAALAAPLNTSATQLRVDMGNDAEWPFHASTADISDGSDGKIFCLWIRIDDEYMKVTATDPKAKTLTVTRGFESTTPVIHGTEATILVPMYLGGRETIGNNARHSNAWPNGPDGLRYALDPAAEATAAFKARFINDMMAIGYDGAWWDTFQPRTFNLCDPLGRRHDKYWNFQTGTLYDIDSFTDAMKTQIHRSRQIAREQAGRNPVISANAMTWNYEGTLPLLQSPQTPELLDGYCFEDAFIEPKWSRRTAGGWDFSFDPISQDEWERNIRNLSDIARRGLQAYAMIGPAGYVMSHFHPGQPNRENLERYAWASFLLTVTAERTTFFGMPLIVTQAGQGYEIIPLKSWYFCPIGDPVETGTLQDYQIGERPVWMRNFESGIVVVSRSESEETVELSGAYRNPETGETMTSVRLGPHDGVILVKS